MDLSWLTFQVLRTRFGFHEHGLTANASSIHPHAKGDLLVLLEDIPKLARASIVVQEQHLVLGGKRAVAGSPTLIAALSIGNRLACVL